MIRQIFQIGIIKTIRINWHYFGLKSLIRPYILCSKKVKLNILKGSVEMKNPRRGCVRLGFHSVGISDYKYERTIWSNSGKIVFEGEARFGSGVRISNRGEVIIGDGVRCTGRSEFVCEKKISIGANSFLAWDILMIDSDYHKIYQKDDLTNRRNPSQEITIGRHCWIGCRCLLKKGTVLPDNTILAAGSNLSSRLEEENCIVGNMGKIIKRNTCWEE